MPRCLVIKNDGLGDLVLTSGVIASIGERFGGDVDLLTCIENREIAEGIAPLRERLYVTRSAPRLSVTGQRFGLVLPRARGSDAEVLKQLRGRRYDVAIVLRRFFTENTAGVLPAVNAERKLCAWQFPTNISPEISAKASAGWERHEGPLDLTSELAYAKGFIESTLGGEIDATPRLTYCHRQTVLPNSRKIALGLASNSTGWQSGDWMEFAKTLAGKGWSFALLGGPNMSELAELLAAHVPRVENLVGRLDFHQTARLLEGCDAYVGNDTGLTHFASLTMRKCMIISGGGTFRRFFPWPNATNQTVLFHALECFDCQWTCKFSERYCMTMVRASDALRTFDAMMTTDTAAGEVNLNPQAAEYELAWRRNTGIRMPFTARTRS